MKEFRDKVAVITGAASGIGRGLAERCAHEGMKVVLADIEEQPLTQTAHELQANGAAVLAVVTDVAKSTDVENLAHQSLSTFGGVHLLCNNAGVVSSTWLWKHTIADWEWIIGVNLWGVIHGLHIFVPIMLEQDVDCHIVNTASLSGLTALPATGSSIYNMTKHAVVSLSETLYLELEQIGAKVKVSVLCPGGVRTRLGDHARNRPTDLPKRPDATEAGPLDTELGRKFFQRAGEESLSPSQVADVVFTAIRDEQFYILTHPAYNKVIRRRMEDILLGHNPTNAMSLFVS